MVHSEGQHGQLKTLFPILSFRGSVLPGDDVSLAIVGVCLLVPMSHFSLVAASFFGRVHLLLMSVILLLILVPESTHDISFSSHQPIGLLSSLGQESASVAIHSFLLSGL